MTNQMPEAVARNLFFLRPAAFPKPPRCTVQLEVCRGPYWELLDRKFTEADAADKIAANPDRYRLVES